MNLTDIPYVAQFRQGACGAAILEMLYGYYGLHVTQQEIFEKYASLELHGSGKYAISTDNIVEDARSRGFYAYWARANYEDTVKCIGVLRDMVRAQIPTIVCQKFTDEQPLLGHFRLILDVTPTSVVLHDPKQEIGGPRLEWSTEKFMDFWQPTGLNVTGGVYISISPYNIHTL